MPSHVFGNGRFARRESQLLQLPVNPRRTPERVRGRHLTYQRADIVWHCRAADAMSALPCPEQAKASPVPREDGFRLDNVNGRAPAAP